MRHDFALVVGAFVDATASGGNGNRGRWEEFEGDAALLAGSPSTLLYAQRPAHEGFAKRLDLRRMFGRRRTQSHAQRCLKAGTRQAAAAPAASSSPIASITESG
jgi:hypothetical protein